jgi:hypothetical protein
MHGRRRRWFVIGLAACLMAACGAAGATDSSTTTTREPLLVVCIHHPNGTFEQEQIKQSELQAVLDAGGIFPVPKDGCASGPPTSTSSSSSSTSTTRAPCVDCTPNTQGVPPTTIVPPGPEFAFNGVSPVCSGDVPFISITFSNNFPQLDGRTGTLTMRDVNGTFISSQPLVFQAGATVRVLYPGATVDAQGNATDWPGWKLNSAGLWVTDPTDAIWRDGINLTYVVNPTATAFVAYPPETAACASPENPPAVSTPGGLPRTD